MVFFFEFFLRIFYYLIVVGQFLCLTPERSESWYVTKKPHYYFHKLKVQRPKGLSQKSSNRRSRHFPGRPRSRMSTGPARQSTSWSNDGRCWSLVSSSKMSYESCTFWMLVIWVFPKIGVPPKSWILIGFSIINHPFCGSPIFGNTHIRIYIHISETGEYSQHPKNPLVIFPVLGCGWNKRKGNR